MVVWHGTISSYIQYYHDSTKRSASILGLGSWAIDTKDIYLWLASHIFFVLFCFCSLPSDDGQNRMEYADIVLSSVADHISSHNKFDTRKRVFFHVVGKLMTQSMLSLHTHTHTHTLRCAKYRLHHTVINYSPYLRMSTISNIWPVNIAHIEFDRYAHIRKLARKTIE